MNFREVDGRYDELMGQYDGGALNDEEFDARRRELMIQDEQGRWWVKGRYDGKWFYHDGRDWVPGTPPGYRRDAPPGLPHEETTEPSPGTNGAGGGVLGKAFRAVVYIVAAVISFSVVSAACQALI